MAGSTLVDDIAKSVTKLMEFIVKEVSISTTNLSPVRGGIWAAASTAIDYIAFIVECMVFSVFLMEESCQIMARLTLDCMCPLQQSCLDGVANTDFDFVLTFATGQYLAHAWTLAYARSGYCAYFNACWILQDAANLICGHRPKGINLT